MSMLTPQHFRTIGVLLAGILTSSYSSVEVWDLELVHHEFRIMWECFSRLDVGVRGICLDARLVRSEVEFVGDTLRCNCLLLGG